MSQNSALCFPSHVGLFGLPATFWQNVGQIGQMQPCIFCKHYSCRNHTHTHTHRHDNEMNGQKKQKTVLIAAFFFSKYRWWTTSFNKTAVRCTFLYGTDTKILLIWTVCLPPSDSCSSKNPQVAKIQGFDCRMLVSRFLFAISLLWLSFVRPRAEMNTRNTSLHPVKTSAQ